MIRMEKSTVTIIIIIMWNKFQIQTFYLFIQLLSAARKQFGDGGARIRYTFPPLIVSAVKLARRYRIQNEQVINAVI